MMEDAESTTVSMLLNEAMEGGEPPSEETGDVDESATYIDDLAVEGEIPDDGQVSEDVTGNEVDSTSATFPEEKLEDGLMEVNHDGFILMEDENPGEHEMGASEGGIEMMEEGFENLKEGEDGHDGQVTEPDQTEEGMEIPDETAAPSETFTDAEFMSQTSALIVQNEPPQQLMEEADGPGEGHLGTDAEDASELDHSAEAETADQEGGMFSYVEGESGEALQEQQEEGIALDQEGETPDQTAPDFQETGQEASDQQLAPDQGQGEAGGIQLDQAQNLPAEGLDEHSDQSMSLPLEDDAAGATEGAEGFTILAGGDQLEGGLGGLEGKLVVGADGTVHLLTPESLQGIQLMEGDDKPEDQANENAAAQMQQDIRAQLHEALLKQEEIKQEQEEEKPKDEEPLPQDQPSAEADGDALATLASAALGHQAPANGVKSEPGVPEVKPDVNEPQWMDVGICKGTHCVVRSFYIPNEGQGWDKNWEGINTTTLPDHRALAKLELEAGKAYKFRVAAINSCGRGPWSEVSAFRTSMPGVPGAPSAIKISKTVEGAHLSWEPPSAASGVIEDYTVYMAVQSATTESQVVSSGANQLAFVRIYQGAENQCSVGYETLSEAHIDTTTKPAILFRIAARNEKGLGPAIQVRWLQDGTIPNSAKPNNAVRRVGSEIKPHGSIKRKKSECE
ncbi:hypothetical protein ONE63_006667 [Megalurothrips usitatus]|uniref:Fibronectin type-III domain-containing protein n=1 Tax=Megalurothrips usitatus TaxID=439358 RepID=A0AAV7XU34_9NEOP|nr:hypothetical protein ONE63_006667 [Megalurothrips usitatus]